MNFFAIDKQKLANISYSGIPIMTYGLIGVTTIMLAIVTMRDLIPSESEKEVSEPEYEEKEEKEEEPREGEEKEGGRKRRKNQNNSKKTTTINNKNGRNKKTTRRVKN